MRTMSRKRAHSTARMRAVRPLLNHRCDGQCEKCGGWLFIQDDGRYLFEAHHRLERSLGGGDEVENLLAVHPVCHNMARWSIHDNPAESRRAGWLLSAGDSPADAPLLYRGQWARLLPDGSVFFVPDFDERF